MDCNIISLRMRRQHLTQPAGEEEYEALYRDLQPGQNVYWNGFGDPPSLSFRAEFDDMDMNRRRQLRRELVKGRFAGGNLGWIVPEDWELFAGLYRKPLTKPTEVQARILTLLKREGPMNIQAMKEETGLLAKEITPILHRLQEAFFIYEDQYDGEWDRGWLPFSDQFGAVDITRYTRLEALKLILPRFAYRLAWFDISMAKAFYRLPGKDLQAAADGLVSDGGLVSLDGGYCLGGDLPILEGESSPVPPSVFALHRNDVLVKSSEPILKERFAPLCQKFPYSHEALQYLLLDGKFCGVVAGHFRNGPYDLEDVVLNLPREQALGRREEILEAVRTVNSGNRPNRFMGEML